MIKKGLLGGSFDPVHLGHLNMAVSAGKTLQLDEVILQPNRIPYYKKQAAASDADRLEMLRLSVEALKTPGIKISDSELKADDYLSTSEVLKKWRAEEPDTALVFIMGMDSWLYFHKWRNYRTITEYASIAVFNRPGHSLNVMEMSEELKELYERHFTGENRITRPFGELFFIESRPFDISSTRLREMLKERNAGVSEYLPDAALEYIKRNGLYL